MSRAQPRAVAEEHRLENALVDSDEIEVLYDRCSELMRELVEALAAAPDPAARFPEVEDAIGWPRRRLVSLLGGVWQLRTSEFAGRRPYRLMGDDRTVSRTRQF